MIKRETLNLNRSLSNMRSLTDARLVQNGLEEYRMEHGFAWSFPGQIDWPHLIVASLDLDVVSR